MPTPKKKLNIALLILSILSIFVALGGFGLALYVEIYLEGDDKDKFIALIVGMVFAVLAIYFETLRNTLEVTKIETEIEEKNSSFFQQISGIKTDIQNIKSDIAGHNQSLNTQMNQIKTDIQTNHNQFNEEISYIQNMISSSYDEIRKEFRIYPVLKSLIPTHFDFLSDLCDIKEKYSASPVYHDLFKKYLPYWFNNFIDTDLADYKSNLEKFILLSEGAKVKHIYEFFNIAWEAVGDGGFINATSIVGPDFWDAASTYLEFQKGLSQSKHATISRYFLFPRSRFAEIASFKRAFELNKQHNIFVRVTLLNRDEDVEKYYHDYGLIDNSIAIINNVEPQKKTIIRSKTIINHVTTRKYITSIAGRFKDLEHHPNTLRFEDMNHDLELFISEIDKKIKEMSDS